METIGEMPKRDQFALEITDGRNPGAWALRISELFRVGDEERVAAALDTLHLRGVFRWGDGSWREMLPNLEGRWSERVYPPASGAAAEPGVRTPGASGRGTAR